MQRKGFLLLDLVIVLSTITLILALVVLPFFSSHKQGPNDCMANSDTCKKTERKSSNDCR